MKKITLFFVLFCLITPLINANEKNRLSEMSNEQIDSLLSNVAQKQMTITEKMNYFSLFFLGTPYSFQCVGDGQYALVEPFPLVNFKETNCMALCEHVLAMSISDSWDNFFNNLQQIRYKDGLIGMRTRNHYTMGDWLPENGWLLENVSSSIGAGHTKSLTRTISHQTFFAKKGIKDSRHVLPDREITIEYIPLSALKNIADKLRIGDIGALLYANKSDIFAAHMFMIAEKEGQLVIREASTNTMNTLDTEIIPWLARLNRTDRYVGVSIMRIRVELDQSGKNILPWQINLLKNSEHKSSD
jgi:hypothetical protein